MEKSDFAFEIQGSNSTSPATSFPFSPLLLIENLSRKSFSSSSYGKLPLHPIKLTVVKLDGSSFDISVVKNPTVTQLKQAVQDAFSHSSKHNISWSHVWAHFCLCFNGQKLLHDHETLGLHRIKDGDQLQFVRHTSISYNLVKEKSEKRDFDFEEPKTSTGKQDGHKHLQKMERGNHSSNQNQQNKENEEDSDDEIAVNITCQCSWAHLLRRLLAHPRQKGHDTSYKELATTLSS